MPIPLMFIGIIAATGSLGIGKGVKAKLDTDSAKKLNQTANEIVENATKRINTQRLACGNSLTHLGEEKMFVLNTSMTVFMDCYQKIKNLDFNNTEGLNELSKLCFDKQDYQEMKSLVDFAGSIAVGAAAGAAGGALAAFGAYSAAQALAVASTGTAIASLSGAAATNATLAFFGGGSLAAGGLGMAGGAAILGGLVAGPALMVLGLVLGHAADKNLDQALSNRAEAVSIAAELEKASLQCEAIRRRIYVFYNLLARLDTYFLPMIYKMEEVVASEGEDYRAYTAESKSIVASCASIAVSVKTILDTPLLTDDGLLTDTSGDTAESVEEFLQKLKIV